MAKAKKKQKKKKKINYYRQPEDLSLRDWQIALRKQYGENQEFTITNVGDHPVWSDFVVHNPKRNTSYRVAIRGKEVGDNSCECYDFKTSTLGTCKHIEWALHKLYHTYGNKQHFKKSIPDRSYSSVYLDYNSGRRIRLRIGTEQQEALSVLAKKYFDQEGIL
ncbi:MAG: ATP-dependent helicase, partial [Bacteroidota bacterium]